MSFDIFVQGFTAGDARDLHPTSLRVALAPYLDADRTHVRVGDDNAEIYLSETSFMVTHVEGDAIWDVLVEVARRCDLVIMPVGCPVALIDAEQRIELPHELRDSTVVVSTGAELLAAILAA